MLRSALKPDMVSYNAVISVCEKGEELRRAFNVGEAMLRQALKPNMVSFNALFPLYAGEKGKESELLGVV